MSRGTPPRTTGAGTWTLVKVEDCQRCTPRGLQCSMGDCSAAGKKEDDREAWAPQVISKQEHFKLCRPGSQVSAAMRAE